MSETERRYEVHDESGREIPTEDHDPVPVGTRSAAAEKVCSAITEMAERPMTPACTESLTGEALCSAFVKIPGASAVLRGPVTAYAVDLKASIPGVDGGLLRMKGPVEEQVALDMACNAYRIMGADVALAITGVAGPGSVDGHAIRTVWTARTGKLSERTHLHRFHGGRSDIRAQTVGAAVDLLIESLYMTFGQRSESVSRGAFRNGGARSPENQAGTSSWPVASKEMMTMELHAGVNRKFESAPRVTNRPVSTEQALLRHELDEVLHEYRQCQGWTLHEVSSNTGASLRYLSEVEHGQRGASLELLSSTRKALNASLSRVLRLIADRVDFAKGRVPSRMRVPDSVPKSLVRSELESARI